MVRGIIRIFYEKRPLIFQRPFCISNRVLERPLAQPLIVLTGRVHIFERSGSLKLKTVKDRLIAVQKKAEAASNHQSARRQKMTVGFFLLFAVLGLGFFLTSKLWMPANIKITHTLPGTSAELSSYASVTIKRWDFDTDQNLLEVEIEKDAGVTGRDYSYAVNAYGDQNTNQIPLEVTYSGESFFAVQIPDAAKYREVILLVRLDIGDQSYGTYFYCDMDQANQTSIKKDKTEAEYMKLNLLSKADIKEQEARTLQEENEMLKSRIEEYNQSIAAIRKEQKYQSGEELDRSNGRIEEYTSAINASEKTIRQNEERIALIGEEADAIQQRAEAIGGEPGQNETQ